MSRWLALLLLPLLAACEEADAPGAVAEPCNGRSELCDLRFDQVAYATSHNAMSSPAARWVAPNQEVGITAQLELGVRALMLDSYDFTGKAMLCQAPAALDGFRWSTGSAR